MTKPDMLPGYLSARAPLWLGGLTLGALIGGFGMWSVLTTISGAIIAPGQIEVEQNRQIVQHRDGGVVSEILVSEGASVKAGDILLKLEDTFILSELSIVEGQLFEAQARRTRLEAERNGKTNMDVAPRLMKLATANSEVAKQLEGQIRLFEARAETQSRTVDQLDKRRGQTLSQIQGIDAELRALTSQLELTVKELTVQKSLLEKGLVLATRVLALQREEAGLYGRVGVLTARRAEAEGRITELELQVLGLSAERREEANTQLRETASHELELIQRQRALAEQVARLDIRAPTSGIVLGLQVTTPRAVLRPADPVAYIIPQNRPLIITVQISPLDVDEVQVGQSVKLMFPAFSSRSTPELYGLLALVSADALKDQNTGATSYRAEITLLASEAERLGHKLLPGMPVEAFIQTEARSPLSYLMKPLTDYFVHAFRET